ncbi:uncharacterized protein [Haliotis asinina]|uniref:uncharacterized protein n=1 Tax=Haliotis asinina TaxID=109174 RepID=UPI0035325B96
MCLRFELHPFHAAHVQGIPAFKIKTTGIHVALLLWLLMIKQVKTSGELEIRFIRYDSDGKDSSGYCCDSEGWTWCPDKCDPIFTLCIDRINGGKQCSLYKRTTNYIHNHNTVQFGDRIHGTPNPFVIYVPNAVPSMIEITVQVFDHDAIISGDHMDTLSKQINIQAAATEQTALYTLYTLRGRTKLIIAVRGYCDTDWYGASCEKQCKATTDNDHYTCHLETGAKLCLEGWKGENCDQDIDECQEIVNTCQNEGSCRNTAGSFHCFCIEGTKGRRCEIILDPCVLQPCLNGGICHGNETAFNCACSVEWTGEICAEKVNVCDSAPCNRGNCTPDLLTAAGFKCNCAFGWVGERCSLRVDIVNITLPGEINDTNRDDLADGLTRLITELGEIPGKVDVKFVTNAHRENNFTSTYVQLYSAVENGSLIESALVEEIFESNPQKVINEYLPLPLYPPRDEEEEKATVKLTPPLPRSTRVSWDTNQYVLAIVTPAGLVLITVLLVVTLGVWRRRSKTTQQYRDNQLSTFVVDVRCNPQQPGPMAGNLQEANVSPDGYTSLCFLRVDESSPNTLSADIPLITLAAEDVTFDPEGQPGFVFYQNDYARLGKAATCATDDTSNIHIGTEDVTLDGETAHCFRVSPNDNVRLGDAATADTNSEDTMKRHLPTEDLTNDQLILRGFDVSPDGKASPGSVATLQQVANITLDPVILRGARASPHDNAGPGDEVATPDTNYDGTYNAIATTEDGSLGSVCLQEPSGYKNYKPHLDTRLRVTSYIQPVNGDISLEAEKEDAEYTVIHDKDVEDLLQEDLYETVESSDDDDVKDISQKDIYEKIDL